MEPISVLTDIGGKKLELTTGIVAEQASGSLLAKIGETAVLATATMSSKPREGIDFFPLLVDYEERMYAAGKISGSRFVKREGRPSDEAVLTSRVVDRSLRPLFPKELRNDVQVVLTVLSVDGENDPDIVSIIAASAALMISEIPFYGPVAPFRISKVGSKFIINSTYKEREESTLDLVVSLKEDKAVMLEALSKEATEEDVLKALNIALENSKKVFSLQQELAQKIGKKKIEVLKASPNEKIEKRINDEFSKKINEAIFGTKSEIKESLNTIKEEIKESFLEEDEQKEAIDIFDDKVHQEVRNNILEKEKRPDGRKLDQIRDLTIKVGVLPRTHGSAIFGRGLTKALTVTTLGSTADVQILDTMEEDATKRYMHHYNFPPYSVGEVRPLRSAGRREIGHGALAEKALISVIPEKEAFPYTIRVVSEILSSNGSTSMASVCGSTLSLMDAGVPIKSPVSGISIGLVTSKDEKKYKLLTDIMGLEDFSGDMDFKVAGTKNGITAIQMDNKLQGIKLEILKEALGLAKKARLLILEKMLKVISKPRLELSKYAPRIDKLMINPEKIKDVIGPGGKVINKIIEETGVEIDIEPDGTVMIFSANPEANKKALEKVKDLTREVQVGEIFTGKVTRVLDFGAFVELFPGQEGMVHVSKLGKGFIKDIRKVVKVGDTMKVEVLEIDSEGRVNLIKKG